MTRNENKPKSLSEKQLIISLFCDIMASTENSDLTRLSRLIYMLNSFCFAEPNW